jgi:chitinase domain-containing protein 1
MRALLLACNAAAVACIQQEVGVQFDGSLSKPLPAACDAGSLARVMSENITSAEVQALHGLACPTLRERSARETLAYVTPWNSKGYAVAARHAEQLSMVAPVWLQLEDAEDGALELHGQHNIDLEWLSAVKRGCAESTEAGTSADPAQRCALVLPRVEWKSQHARGSRHLQRAAVLLLKLLRKHAHLLDGIVLEAPVSPQLFELFSYLAERLHAAVSPRKALPHMLPTPASVAARQAVTGLDRGFVFVLVLPPALLPEQSATGRRGHGITPSEFRHLAGFVDRFSLMLYDYSMHRGKAGPNCPLHWQNATVREFVAGADNPEQLARKVLMGVPFYG